MKSLLFILTGLLSITSLDCKESQRQSGVKENQIDVIKTRFMGSKSSSESTNTLFKGTLNGTKVIWLYLSEQENPCGGDRTTLSAMYKYEDQKKWILLDVSSNTTKKNFCLVEDEFTGVMLLTLNGNSFNGNWKSPDDKKQFEVKLEKTDLTETKNESLQEILFDDLIYNRNDC